MGTSITTRTLKIWCKHCDQPLTLDCEYDEEWNRPLNTKGVKCAHCQGIIIVGLPGRVLHVWKGHAGSDSVN